MSAPTTNLVCFFIAFLPLRAPALKLAF